MGSAEAGCGDLDGDGLADMLVGQPNTCGGSGFSHGSVAAYSGLTGRRLYRVTASDTNADFGTVIACIGDVDGDSIPDFLAGIPSNVVAGVTHSGSIRVYSGATGSQLYERVGGIGDGTTGDELGFSARGISDIDGDGRADLVLGSPGALNGAGQRSGAVIVCSGATGQELRRIDGAGDGDAFGSVVEVAGDLDGDGIKDILISAPGAGGGAAQAVGRVSVYSGVSDSLLYSIDGPQSGSGYGATLTGLGDLDGDGRSDFAVGAPDMPIGVQGFVGSVFVYSGSTGTLIRRLDGSGPFDHFGFSLASADVDGDGLKDLAVGAPTTVLGGANGAVFVYSGADGSLLLRVDGTRGRESLGTTIAGVGDANGDGRDDMLLRAQPTGTDPTFSNGAALLFGLADVLPARVFIADSRTTIRLGVGPDAIRAQVEPTDASYTNSEVWLSTIVLRPASDAFQEIRPVLTDAAVSQDNDRNGIDEIGARFSKADLRRLFGLPSAGSDTATIQVEAILRSGARIRATTRMLFVSGPPLVVVAVPNPMRVQGILSFITTRAGPLTVRLYDAAGRLRSELLHDPHAQAGYHDLTVASHPRATLSSGVYFYKVDSMDGTASGSVAIIK